jgi:hypothetical protein
MENKLCFVQFIHPGGEHTPDKGNIKFWNRAGHQRKFIKNPGQYINSDKIEDGEMVFWAEWEPESKVASHITNPLPDGPRYIYNPYYVVPPSYDELQNTDPFVFGQQFYYEGCKQRRATGPTQLRYLSRGSVILFGSCVGRQDFVLDTVFVVDDWIDHNRADFRKLLADAVPEAYKVITVSPWYHESFSENKGCIKTVASQSWRLYFGAMFENPIHGMFSFFPCLPYEDGSKGFARPRIRIPRIVTGNLTQGQRLNPQNGLHSVKTLWEEVVRQVIEQGLMLGVCTEIPQQVQGDSTRK